MVLDHIYLPQTAYGTISPEKTIANVGPLSLQLEVSNLASADSFEIDVENSLDFPMTVSQSPLELAQGESNQLTIELEIPSYSSGLLEFTVLAFMTSQSDASIRNFAQAQVAVERFNIITTDSFESLDTD